MCQVASIVNQLTGGESASVTTCPTQVNFNLISYLYVEYIFKRERHLLKCYFLQLLFLLFLLTNLINFLDLVLFSKYSFSKFNSFFFFFLSFFLRMLLLQLLVSLDIKYQFLDFLKFLTTFSLMISEN